MTDLFTGTERDRDYHLRHVKLRLQRTDGTFTDLDRAQIASFEGNPLPPNRLPSYVVASAEGVRYNQSQPDPTVYLQEL